MLVTVARTEMAPEAHILRGRLEAEGIPAFVLHEHHVTMDWFVSNALGGVKLQVPVEHAADAIAVLKELREGGFSLALQDFDDGLADTASMSQPEAVTCPNCGAEGEPTTGNERGLALAFLFLIALPTPWRRLRWRCTACGHAWSTRSGTPYGVATAVLGGLLLLIGMLAIVLLASIAISGLCEGTRICPTSVSAS